MNFLNIFINSIKKIKISIIGYSPFYFISFMLITNYILLHFFTLILLQQFEEFHKNPYNPIFFYKDSIEDFEIAFNSFSTLTFLRRKIHISRILQFLRELGPPIGLNILKTKQKKI